MLYLRHSSAGFRPASASFKMPMICSSVNRFFIAVPLWNGLYTVTVLNAGSRSHSQWRATVRLCRSTRRPLQTPRHLAKFDMAFGGARRIRPPHGQQPAQDDLIESGQLSDMGMPISGCLSGQGRMDFRPTNVLLLKGADT